MRVIIIEGLGNTVMLILLGLALTMGIAVSAGDRGLTVTVNGFALAPVVYLILYGLILMRMNGERRIPLARLMRGLQTHADVDERERLVTDRAARAGHHAAMCGMGAALVLFTIAHLASAGSMLAVDLHAVGCWLLVLVCVITNLAFSLTWAREYAR